MSPTSTSIEDGIDTAGSHLDRGSNLCLVWHSVSCSVSSHCCGCYNRASVVAVASEFSPVSAAT